MPDTLARFRRAWDSAADTINAKSRLPSLSDLEAHDAPLDDSGFILFARTPSTTRNMGRPLYTIVLAGSGFIHSKGKPFAGLTIDEMLDPTQAASITDLYNTILDQGEPHTWTTLSISYNTPPRRYTRTIAPVAAPKTLSNTVMGLGQDPMARPSTIDLARFQDATGWLAGLWDWHRDARDTSLQTGEKESLPKETFPNTTRPEGSTLAFG